VPLAKRIPTAEKNIFILDISGSTNSQSLWKNSLRPSILKRLGQPFGMPSVNGSAPQPPLDISVSLITSQSMDAPSFPIVTQADAQRVWGLIDEIGERPSAQRLDAIVGDIFGGGGAFAKQAQLLSRNTISVPAATDCEASMVTSFDGGQYMGNLELPKKKKAARVFCSALITFAKRILATDQNLLNPVCGSSKACSDIAGAILKTNYAAMDAYQLNRQSKFCVAIASDMLNNYPGMSASSPLNSQMIALTSPSPQQAKEKGIEAAAAVGIKFPKGMNVKVSIMGQGSGPKPLPLEKNSMLTSYWQGFWEGAGVKSSNQVRSLDQACSF
jgi:hypothetical protein